MVFWGLLFVAIGVGALLNISLWPLVLIVVGVAMLLPVLTGGRRSRNRYGMWWCWWDPSAWERSRERRRDPTWQTIRKLATALGLKRRELVDDDR